MDSSGAADGLGQPAASDRLAAADHSPDNLDRPNQPGARRKSPSGGAPKHRKTPLELLVFNYLLPFILMFLLPNIRIVDRHEQRPASTSTGSLVESLLSDTPGELLLSLVRLPIDRFRIESSHLIAMVSAKELSHAPARQHTAKPQADLQEEEQTHMMLLAPAEHHTSYMPPHGAAYGDMQVGGTGDQTSGQPAPGEYAPGEGEPSGGGVPSVSGAEQPLAGADGSRTSALQSRNDLPSVRALNVKCEKNHMTVNIVFDRPFYGMVFSKGHYNDPKCVHLPPNSGQTSVNFDIHLGKCGMSSSEPAQQQQQQSGLQQANGQQQQQPNGLYIENTVIIQYDPQVQEIYDQARKLRCTWYDYYEKSVTFRPYNVDMLDAVTANFLGDNIQCWMQIQVGKGPWSSEVAGIVKIGQTMTMVLGIKDDDNKFDMLVRNCVAHDGHHPAIQLVDEYGCVVRPKIMARFQKVKNFGPTATVVSYAHFQAFKFPDSMSVHFQCVIQVCRFNCPEAPCPHQQAAGELAAAGAQAAPSTGDYATSGTEMVASKEPLPGVGLYATAPPAANKSAGLVVHPAPSASSMAHQHGNNVQLKLDESQGRVQVKLDTSMMAGNSRAAANGPLPPHLLHMQSAAPVAAHQQMRTPGGASSAGRQPPTGPRMMAQQVAVVAPSGAGQSVQYSHPYNSMGRRSGSSFASRLGELSPGSGDEELDSTASDKHQSNGRLLVNAAPYDQSDLLANPLSLLAAPRGLRMGSPISSSAQLPASFDLELGPDPSGGLQHRFKRDALAFNMTADERLRLARSPREDSTSVRTQKTIQVVSPDDVAFNLMTDDDDDDTELSGQPNLGQTVDYFAKRRTPSRQQQQQSRGPTVCFSTARFLAGLLVTLGALASSIVIVAFVVLRQRSRLKQKISNAFECPVAEQLDEHPHADQLMEPHEQQRQRLHAHQKQAAAMELLMARQRQRDEIQQRNTYLARLYSQFSPSAYWSAAAGGR